MPDDALAATDTDTDTDTDPAAADPAPDPSAQADASGGADGGSPSPIPTYTTVEVTNPAGPTNSKQSGPIQVSTNAPDRGTFQLTGDLVTFEISNDGGAAVTCAFELDDDQQAGVVLAVGSLSWAAGDTGTQYIQFQNFPLRADQASKMTSCRYAATLTNDAQPHEGAAVWENIY